MSGYTKIFESILESTVWQGPLHVRVVWVSMLAMADRDGVVEASVPGLAKRAGVSRKQAEEAIAVFLAPDPDSRTTDHEGRRIAKVDGGWLLLNHEKYRDKESPDEQRAKAALRQQRKRDREKAEKAGKASLGVTENHAPSRDVTLRHAESRRVTPSEADAESEAEAIGEPHSASLPRTQPGVLGRVANLVQQAAISGYREMCVPPPRETRDFAWRGWADIARWLIDAAEAQGWPADWESSRPAWIVGKFLADPWAEKRGFPISHLAANPAQYALAKTEEAA